MCRARRIAKILCLICYVYGLFSWIHATLGWTVPQYNLKLYSFQDGWYINMVDISIKMISY